MENNSKPEKDSATKR